ncbi:anthranilate phosphoribosyltransferase [Candidatus Contubernalis alkalaceticus]|uniref:anthranilate phosphoribosyltransferase n=1 Tax=Candidatus Contubernalis alkaliaceticus TaxID=338645 RepID=UPI002A4E2028|nr:anthranilate phosphoribosyltransferase [Candidatus Contubernalis alkalaceticus]
MLNQPLMLNQVIDGVVRGRSLNIDESVKAMDIIMSGEATDAQIASLLTALRMKGETIEEITGFARVMREKVTPVKVNRPGLVDTCGTGGDQAGTFNISTTAAFVAAGAGLPVAKHGNRSVSSRCGSADVLEALGVNLELSSQQVAQAIEQVGIGFLFAPKLHLAMKYAIGPRREIGIRTVFNLLGPLTNPAGAKRQVMGVYDPALTEMLARVLLNLGAEHALVVHGLEGLDEISICGPTRVSEVKEGKVATYSIDPVDLGFPKAEFAQMGGGTPRENAEITLSILRGEKGPRRDVVVLNAAAVLMSGGLAGDFPSSIELAQKVLDSGSAYEKLEELRKFCEKI